MRARTILLAGAGLALIVASFFQRPEVRPEESVSPAAAIDRPASIEIFYTPPVLVPAGRDVRLPVDAVCTTEHGNVCSADVTLGTQVGLGPWETVTAPARPGLEFDVTDATARAIRAGTGYVRFFLRAQNATGLATSTGTPQTPLKFWVTTEISKIEMPTIPFGRVRKPETALFLPWGSGPLKAGLSLGRESLTVGPSAFDVDEAGRVYLVDGEQDRLAVFSGGRLARETSLELESQGDLSVAADGTAYVLDVRKGVAHVRTVSASGLAAAPLPVGEALSSHIRVVGNTAFANVLPADTWVRVPRDGDTLPSALGAEASVARPIGGDDQLLRVGTSSTVRLAEISGDALRHAVEIQSEVALGEVALAEPDGGAGYWCVIRVWRDGPSPADQYQVLHVQRGNVVESFAVSSEQYADTPPLSTFRLGGDGDLYQLATSPSGVRILRFDLGEEA